MIKILKYSFFDLIRSRWTYLYFGFYLLFTLSLLWLSSDPQKVVISLMNVVLVLCPLIATMFGVMSYYNSREFTELLLAQPIRRSAVFWGQYLGLALSLSGSLLLGIALPFLIYGIFNAGQNPNIFILLLNGVLLSFVFSGLAFLIALCNENRIRGFGLAILVWLFFAVVYDGLFLVALMIFSDYPLEPFAIAASFLNPIDLARILLLLKLDISALMGYTGAVFQRFLGDALGKVVALSSLLLWVVLPALSIRRVALRKDF